MNSSDSRGIEQGEVLDTWCDLQASVVMCEQPTTNVVNQNSRPFIPSSSIVPDDIAEKYLALQNQNPKQAATIVREVLRKLERRGPGGEFKYDDSESEPDTQSILPMASSAGFGGRQQLFLMDKEFEGAQQLKEPKPEQRVCAILNVEGSKEPGLAKEAGLQRDEDMCPVFGTDQRKEPGIPAMEAEIDRPQNLFLCPDLRRNRPKQPEPHQHVYAALRIEQRKQPDLAKEPKRNEDVNMCSALHQDLRPSGEVDKRAQPQPQAQARLLQIEPYRGTVAGSGPGPGGVVDFRGSLDDHLQSLRADLKRRLIRSSGGEYSLQLFDQEALHYMSEDGKRELAREDVRLSMTLAEERTQHLKARLALHQGRLDMREAFLQKANRKYADILRRKPAHPWPDFTYAQYTAWMQWVTDLQQHLKLLGHMKDDLQKERSCVAEVQAGLAKAFEEQKRVAKKMLQLDDNASPEPLQETRLSRLTRARQT